MGKRWVLPSTYTSAYILLELQCFNTKMGNLSSKRKKFRIDHRNSENDNFTNGVAKKSTKVTDSDAVKYINFKNSSKDNVEIALHCLF